jgi:hypothetical protein
MESKRNLFGTLESAYDIMIPMSSMQPIDWVPVTVPGADADLLAREGLFVGIRALTAFPAGVAFRLVIRVRDQEVADDQVDYRGICGHAMRGVTTPPGGLALRAQAETAGTVSECWIWPGSGGGRSYSASGDFAGTQVNYDYWLPIPADAAGLALTADWPDQDVGYTRLELDLEAIRAAARRSVRV